MSQQKKIKFNQFVNFNSLKRYNNKIKNFMKKILAVLVFILVIICLFFVYPDIGINISFFLAVVIKSLTEILKMFFNRDNN